MQKKDSQEQAAQSLSAQVPEAALTAPPEEDAGRKKRSALFKLKLCNMALATAVVALTGTVSVMNFLGGPYSLSKVYTINVDDAPTISFSQKEQAQAALDYYLTNKGYDTGCDVYLAGRVEIEQVRGDTEDVYTDPKQAAQALDETLSPLVVASAVKVNGEEKVWLAGEEEAQAVLDTVKDSYLPEGDQITVMVADFRQQVEVEPVLIPESQVMEAAQATGTLLSPEVNYTTYQVKEGDSVERIAQLYGVTPSSLYLYNQSLVEATAMDQVSELTIATAEPLLNLVSRVKVTDYNDIPYAVTYVENRQAASGTQEVTQQGQAGTEEIITELFLENGKEIERTQLSTAVVSEPVNEVISLGGAFSTASRGGIPVDYSFTGGSGIIQWPVTGVLTSYYGGRRNHTGLDIATTSGTPIQAAASGIVTFVGWSGGYGNIVKLNNGNGMETWYAHMSATAAEVGSYVEAGDVIGYVGSTGNSTGPHLHLEVRFNGVHYDPLDYLP